MYPLVLGSAWYDSLLGSAADLQGKTLALLSYQDNRAVLMLLHAASVKLCCKQSTVSKALSDFAAFLLLDLVVLMSFTTVLLLFRSFSSVSLKVVDFLAMSVFYLKIVYAHNHRFFNAMFLMTNNTQSFGNHQEINSTSLKACTSLI